MFQLRYWYRAAWCFEEIDLRNKAIARAKVIKKFGGTMITIIPIEMINHDAIAQKSADAVSGWLSARR
jgi:hypothetical protein